MDETRETGPANDDESTGTAGRDEAGAADDAADRFDDPIPRAPIEPESVDHENAVFVVLGALLTVSILVVSL
jgi:hypothetical protein